MYDDYLSAQRGPSLRGILGFGRQWTLLISRITQYYCNDPLG
jgi:hypothetical protein